MKDLNRIKSPIEEIESKASEFLRSLSKSMNPETFDAASFTVEVVPARVYSGYEVFIVGTVPGKTNMRMTEGSSKGWTEQQASQFAAVVSRGLDRRGKLKE